MIFYSLMFSVESLKFIVIKSKIKLKKNNYLLITFDISSLLQLNIQILKSVNLGYLYFNFNHLLEFFVKSCQNSIKYVGLYIGSTYSMINLQKIYARE